MTNKQKKNYTILIIEDNEINCEILQEILQDRYSLLFAHNGEEGLEMLCQHYREIEVVLLDIQMPVMDGYELLKAKNSERLLKDIPVIVTTSSDSSDEEIKCLEHGAQDFVRKPYEPVVVRLRIESIINLRESTEANLQKTLFIQNISHEIRTPMNSIMGFAQVLEDMADSLTPDELRMFCGSIKNSSRDLMAMVDNMVALSDYDINAVPLHLKSVSPNYVCRQAMNIAAGDTSEGVNLYFTSDVDDAFMIKSDGKSLELAVFNLIANARKFTTEGEIHVHCAFIPNPSSLTQDRSSLVITVTDTGIGIPKDKAEYIFERFTKLDAFVPGLGLGLAVARNVALTLNGSIYLDTTYTAGSRFVLQLPVGK